MPSQEELTQIVKEMRSQGLSDDEIRETLEDMGISSEVIASIFASDSDVRTSASSPAPSKAQSDDLFAPITQHPSSSRPSAPPSSSDDLFAPSPAPSKDVLSELMTAGPAPSVSRNASSAPEVPETRTPAVPESKASPREEFSASIATPPILEEESVPAEKLDEIHTKVDALHKALSSATLRDDVAEVKEMLRELKRELHDVKIMFSAIQKLLQEILETDRSILVDLYEKSKK